MDAEKSDASTLPAEIQRVENAEGVRFLLPVRCDPNGSVSGGVVVLMVPIAMAAAAVAAAVRVGRVDSGSIAAVGMALAFLVMGWFWGAATILDIVPFGMEFMCTSTTLRRQTTLRWPRARKVVEIADIAWLETQRLYDPDTPRTVLRLTRKGKPKDRIALATDYPLAWLNALARDLARTLDAQGGIKVVELPPETFEDITGNPEPESMRKQRESGDE